MKKPLLQRKWIWVLIVCIIAVGYSEIKSQFTSNAREKEQAQLAKNADKILKGKVEVPDTDFETKEEVTELFKAAGLTPNFVVSNFDDKATKKHHYLREGECDELDRDQPGIEYYSVDKVGDKFGYYADKGATIIVGYSDHDFDGTGKKKSSSKVTKKKTNESSVQSNESKEKIDDWYTPDSQYATMESVKKTVDGQMEEIGVDDPVRAIIVNEIQTYLFSLDGSSLEAIDINQNLEYSRYGFYLDLKYDGSSLDESLSDQISDELLRVSGHKYTIE